MKMGVPGTPGEAMRIRVPENEVRGRCRGHGEAAAGPDRTSDRGSTMKKLLLATTAFVVLAAASASAADMAVRPAYAPPPAYIAGTAGTSVATSATAGVRRRTILPQALPISA